MDPTEDYRSYSSQRGDAGCTQCGVCAPSTTRAGTDIADEADCQDEVEDGRWDAAADPPCIIDIDPNKKHYGKETCEHDDLYKAYNPSWIEPAECAGSMFSAKKFGARIVS